MFRTKLIDDMRPYIKYSIIVIVYLAVVSSTLVFLTGSHPPIGSKITYPRTGSIAFASVKKEITPSIDMALSFGNATFYLPKGSTNMAGYLSMILREPNLFTEAGEPGWSRPFAVNVEVQNYQGTPAPATSFFKNAQICFQVNEKMWQDYTVHPAAYQVEYYAESLGVSRWIALPRYMYPEHLQLCGETDHLSLFALAINVGEGIPDPVIPITGATPIPTIAPTILIPTDIPPTKEHDHGSSPVIAPIIVTTAVPPTTLPTDIIPTDPPATDLPPTDPSTDVVPTDPPATDPPATDPPATNPPADTSAPPADAPSG